MSIEEQAVSQVRLFRMVDGAVVIGKVLPANPNDLTMPVEEPAEMNFDGTNLGFRAVMPFIKKDSPVHFLLGSVAMIVVPDDSLVATYEQYRTQKTSGLVVPKHSTILKG